MAIVWLDGFEGYTATTDLTARGYSLNGSGTQYLQAQTARISGNGNSIYLTDDRTLATPDNILATPTVITGFAMKIDDVNTQNVGSGQVIYFYNTTNLHLTINFTTGGTVRALLSGSSLVGSEGTISAFPPNGAWFWVETKVLISTTVGTVLVKINGVTVLNLSSVNTQGFGGSANVTRVAIAAENYPAFFDDWYVADTSGSFNNDFLGSIKVCTSNPIGNGATNQWTAVGAGSNFQCVDETAVANGNTDYVEDSTAGHFDLYDVTSVPTGLSGKAVWIECSAEKTIAGTREIKILGRSGGSDAISGVKSLTQSTYNYFNYVADQDPNGSITWTGTNINAAEFGVKLET